MEQQNISAETENKNEVNQESVERIEKALENFSPNPDVVILEEAVTATPSRLAELYDKSTASVKAILGAMLFAVTVQASAGQEIESAEKVEPEMSFSQTMEMKEKIKDITGIDIVAEAKKVNREVKLYTPEKPTIRTIVNLGQTHNTSQEENWRARDEISESQKSIAKFLTATSTSQTKVFVENFYTGDREKFMSYHLFSESIKETDSFSKLSNIYFSFEDLDVSIKNKMTAEKLISMGFVEIEPLRYVKDGEEMLLSGAGVFPSGHEGEVAGDIELNIKSSVVPLYVKGLLDFYPAEKSSHESGARKKLKDSTLEFYKKVKKLNNILYIESSVFNNDTSVSYKSEMNKRINAPAWGDLFINDKDNPSDFIKSLANESFCKHDSECKKITTEMIEKDIPDFKKVIFDDREDEAISLIAKQASPEQNFFPLVYGKNHDFTRAVKKWNDNHPEQQFNLVTVKNQKYF